MTVLKMTDLDLRGKRVLIREDLNVPVKEGRVTSDARILASLPTIEHALKAGAQGHGDLPPGTSRWKVSMTLNFPCSR